MSINFRGKGRETEGERKRDRDTDLLSYLFIHWRIPVCALTRDQTCNLTVLGQHSKQLSFQARAWASNVDSTHIRDGRCPASQWQGAQGFAQAQSSDWTLPSVSSLLVHLWDPNPALSLVSAGGVAGGCNPRT